MMQIIQEPKLHDLTPKDTQLDFYTIESYLENLKCHTLHMQETMANDSPHDLSQNKE